MAGSTVKLYAVTYNCCGCSDDNLLGAGVDYPAIFWTREEAEDALKEGVRRSDGGRVLEFDLPEPPSRAGHPGWATTSST